FLAPFPGRRAFPWRSRKGENGPGGVAFLRCDSSWRRFPETVMATHRATVTGHREGQRSSLGELLREYDRSWDERRLARGVPRLPPPGIPLRRVALVEMVKLDLRRQWQLGRHARLEAYLKVLPELGDRDTVPVSLIQAEYEARRLAGAPAAFRAFA